MSVPNPNRSPPRIESLAERFIEQLHDDESPTIEGYAGEYPALADEIRELFPTILNMETLRRHKSSGRPIPGHHAERMPDSLGDFRIIREIGRGGMGIVYEAEQLSLRRHVALKVLPRGYFNNRVRRDRFQREAQIVGRLHHTNIVPVHGIGSDEGYDFFVMQYIDGVSLDQLIAVNKAIGERIDWQRVARFGIQTARAMHYAHEQGVLHRDIKPANLLLGSDESSEHERVWIADFGLALALESDAERSESVGTPGTLRYMPLEQLEGQPTARSDLYSLGLTLYELLTGRPAYQDSVSSQLLGRIRQGDITPLRSVDTNLPRDLEAILRKATDKEELQRYHTAKDLADDLERLLSNRPVRARRITPLGHAVRWTQRNPLAAALSCIAAVLFIGIITATTQGYLSAKAGERREAAMRQSEQEQRLREGEQRRRAEAALEVAIKSLDELFSQIESNRRPGQRLAPEEAQSMLAAIERMLAFYEQLAEQGQSGPESQIPMAEALRRMGDLQRSLHEYEDAESTLLTAIALLDRLIEDRPDQAVAQIQHARANYTLGRVYRDTGRLDEGDALIQLAITELEDLPDNAPQRRHLQELLSRFRRDTPRAAGK
ncbi:serine/threonine protein kinase [Novipirellula artificiosorum]|uniref:Serine/threonine-protein kinase PrkC n=1 Tax=Novipirellula artificiosorum TaxID=2528016 RepID=A0A5C6DY60_9BACT|nr:serine/threonine-protein kinase [Novipirellula artificiosorum]TWU39779.1 Serine/threonine-protein kinase PrkC [Novipirellula artificiosorum]